MVRAATLLLLLILSISAANAQSMPRGPGWGVTQEQLEYGGCAKTLELSRAVQQASALSTAAEKGDGRAAYLLYLANCNCCPGSLNNREVGARWLERAVALGEPNALNWRATQYEAGWDGFSQSDERALYWYRRAGDAGSLDGMLTASDWLSQGRGAKRQDKEAFEWARKAAALGSPGGMFRTAEAYFVGRGVPKDDSAAMMWYRRSVQANPKYSFEAMNAIGWMYEWGLGVSKDLDEARRWYARADKRGKQNLRNLGRGSLSYDRLSRLLPPPKPDPFQAYSDDINRRRRECVDAGGICF